MASTGSSCDAVYAGKNPAMMPIFADTVNPKTMLETVSDNGNGTAPSSASDNKYTRKIPMMPPIRQSSTASNRN